MVVCAEDIRGVSEAAAVYGEVDVILKIEGKSEQDQDQTWFEVRKIPFIKDTQTYRLITPGSGLYFNRVHDLELSGILIER